jgi:citrate synthase
MLQAIGSTDRVESFVQQTLAAKKRFMGFGHRVYKGQDPRAPHLRYYAQKLSEIRQDSRLLDVCDRLQAVVLEAKSLYVNVDFYSAPLLHHLGIATELFTALFATSRIAGWSAHVIEQNADNRLIRPLGLYVGPRDLKYVPIHERGTTSDAHTA